MNRRDVAVALRSNVPVHQRVRASRLRLYPLRTTRVRYYTVPARGLVGYRCNAFCGLVARLGSQTAVYTGWTTPPLTRLPDAMPVPGFAFPRVCYALQPVPAAAPGFA